MVKEYSRKERALELLGLFELIDDEYLRSEVEEAVTLQAEMVPLLIGHLEDVVADPDGYILADGFAHNYALALLSHFRETSAHSLLIKSVSLSGNQVDALWGELLTDGLSVALYCTAGGNFAALKELVLNKEADPFVRGAAVESFAFAVAEGVLSRDEALSFFATLLADDSLAPAENYFWAALVSEMAALHPTEYMEQIRGLYGKGLVSIYDIPLEHIERIAAEDRDKRLARLSHLCAERVPKDIHSYISWFECFARKESDLEEDDDYFSDNILSDSDFSASDALLHASQKNKKVKARIQRKLAKKSKKKNRK